MRKVCLFLSSAHLKSAQPWDEQLPHIAKLGAKGLEVFGNDFLEYSGGRCMTIRDAAKCHGLVITAHPWLDLAPLPEPRAVQVLEKILVQCQLLSIRTINLHLNFLSDNDQGVERAVAIVQSILPLLRRGGQELLFENVPFYLENSLGHSVDHLQTFFDRVDDPEVNLNIDVGHSNICKNTDLLIRELHKKWKYTHVADNDGTSDSHLGPGMGTVDWGSFADQAAKYEYEGPFICEFSENHLPSAMPVLSEAFSSDHWTWNPLVTKG